jgi:molybdopterin synthase catalytic subunit
MTLRRLLIAVVAAAAVLVVVPTEAEAQSAFAGVVRDTTGALMPGVTVEAASPVLIERVRTARHRRQRRIPHRRPAAWHLYPHLHPRGFQYPGP